MATRKKTGRLRKSEAPEAQQQHVSEEALNKAIADLEDRVEKSDELQRQNPDGGLATEGTPLRGRKGASTSKGMPPQKKGAAAAAADDGEDEGDDETETDEGDDETDETDDETEDTETTSKSMSISEAIGESDEVQKALDVAPFLENLLAGFDAAQESLTKALGADIDGLRKSLVDQARLGTALAKGLVLVDQRNARIEEKLDHLLNNAAPPARKSVISKAEVVQPRFGAARTEQPSAQSQPSGGLLKSEHYDDAEGVDEEALVSIPAAGQARSVQGWLIKACRDGRIDLNTVTNCELQQYDPRTLPADVQKALVNDLCGGGA